MNKGIPTVSVIIPTYRRPAELERALRSVLDQNFSDIEVIVVDDNPPDSAERRRTEELLGRTSGPLRHLKNDTPLGGAGARNVGIQAAGGQFIAFLDDDDQWLPGKLQKQMDLFAGLAEDVCSVDTGFYEIDQRRGTTRTVMPALRGEIFDALLVKHKGRAPKLSSMVCRAAALRRVGGFDEQLPSRQDLDLYLRLARHYRFEYIAEPLMNKYIHNAGRISAVSDNKIRGFEMLYRKYRDDLAARPALHRRYLRRHAFWLAKAWKLLRAAGKYLRSLLC